jgi:hypothetical protein
MEQSSRKEKNVANENEVELLDVNDILMVEDTATAVSSISVLSESGIDTQLVIHTRVVGFCVGDPEMQLDFMLSPERARKYVKQLMRTLVEHDRDHAVTPTKQNPPATES